MKITLKSTSDKVTAVILYFMSTAIAITSFLICKYMYLNGIYNGNVIENVSSSFNTVLYVLKYPIIAIVVTFSVASMFLIAALMANVNYDENNIRIIDRCPFDFFTICCILFVTFDLSMIYLKNQDVEKVSVTLSNAIEGLTIEIAFLVLLIFFLSLAVRMKAGNVLKNTIIYHLFSKKNTSEKTTENKKSTFKKLIWLIICIFAVDVFLLLIDYFTHDYKTHQIFSISLLILAFFIGIMILFIAINFNKLKETGSRIISGDYENTNINSKLMFGDFKEINNDLITIKDDLIKALEEKNKTEQLRSELIANVSHDIKSPLTSIINYTNIIKSGKCSPEELNEYSNIIDNQSIKLTNLLQSLIDISQITAGTIKIDLEKLDLNIFMAQVFDECNAKFEPYNFTIDYENPQDSSFFIMADGPKLWRIFDNIISNICKYALENTRIYFSIEKTENKKIKITIKNISKNKINLSSEDLLERFTRGDAPRTTEGNGLGLSIIKRLTELQGGSFNISVDGDLFKTEIEFDEIR